MAKVGELKFCKACLEWRPETDFYFHAGCKRRRNKCKHCEKKRRPVKRVEVKPIAPNRIQRFLCGGQP